MTSNRPNPRETSSSSIPQPGRPSRRRRGVALLLVMVGVVVCSILTAGFLSTQGTSIGIARNERDAQKCRVLAQTGIDMCYWLIRNKSDWRSSMPVGTWLSAVPVGDGVVTVSVADGDNSGSFSDDTTQGVVVTSTGTYDSRSFSLTATIKPTGGGTVYNAGSYIVGKISIGNSDLLTGSTVDSYNSNIAAYNSLIPGSNASFGSSSNAVGALTVYFPSLFRGSYTAPVGSILSSVLSLVGLGVSGPASTSTATEARTPGTVLQPNTTALVYRNTWNKTTSSGGTMFPFPAPGKYDSASASGVGLQISYSGIYYITGSFSLSNSASSLNVDDGVSAVLIVDGNTTISGKIILNGTSQLALYCNNPVTIGATNVNLNGNTSHFTLFGGANCSSVTITGATSVFGSIYAPQAILTMQTGTPKLYGAVIASQLTLKNTAALHFDEALRSLRISNLTGGSAAPGSADYRVTIMGGSGLH